MWKSDAFVATALTVYGIETKKDFVAEPTECRKVATALTVYGIETDMPCHHRNHRIPVVTVLTVYGMRRRVQDSRGAKRR